MRLLSKIYSLEENFMHSIRAILVTIFVALPATGFAQEPEQTPQTIRPDKSITAKIVSTQVIKKREDTRSSTDLVAFNDQLFLTFLGRHDANAAFRRTLRPAFKKCQKQLIIERDDVRR